MRQLPKSTIALVAGIILALVALLVGAVASARLTSNVTSLVADCSTQHLRPSPSDKLGLGASDQLVCGPEDLLILSVSPSGGLGGIQAEIANTQAASVAWLTYSRIVAAVIFVLLAVPYLWYFVLRRITELRQAMLGK